MNGHIVQDHFRKLRERYPNVILDFEKDKHFVRGELRFCAQYQDNEIMEVEYTVEIELSANYPISPPKARELKGEIPRTFHTFSDGTLCLGAPLAIKEKFSADPTLVGFVENLLVPYLYTHKHLSQKSVLPYGELDHGAKGIMKYYMELFEVTEPILALNLLYLLAYEKVRGHLPCPCGGGAIIRKCHAPILKKIQGFQTPKEFEYELNYCYKYYETVRGRK
ncbi:hypothetical protein [Paenibacillus sp. sgz500992]|uniref:hypothetical protein n=1 Tax=Paenibacillus sp. sgz500992 TaxID=3242476 RepID=UPI0036D2A7EB